jgi:hypothetical protein
MALIWGSSIDTRRIIALLGLAIIGTSFFMYVRDWHFPFVRDRNLNPGIVDRRNKIKLDTANAVIFDEQRRVSEDQQRVHNEAQAKIEFDAGVRAWDSACFQAAFTTWSQWGWHTDHHEGADLDAHIHYPVLALLLPDGWDGRRSMEWKGRCKVTFEDDTFVSLELDCSYSFGFTAIFPRDFPGSPSCPLPTGTYAVEWECDHPILAERGRFDVGEHGVLTSRA